MQRILGIDPGLATVGFGCIQACEPLVAVEYGIISTPSTLTTPERLQMIYEDLNSLMHHLQPDTIGIEKLFFYKMGNTIQVAQARGVILLVLAQHQLSPIEFTPAQIKLSLTGYGKSSKPEVQAAVTQELRLHTIPRPDDAADALAIALTVWHHRFGGLVPSGAV